MKKRLIFALFLILLVIASGCKGKKDSKKALEEARTGTQGLSVTFLANNPPPTIHAEDGAPNTFDVILELRNKGAHPETGSLQGLLYLSGFDPKIVSFGDTPIQPLNDKALEGKSSINPNGGLDLVKFEGKVDYGSLKVERYEPTLLATACYKYRTIAEPSVCIDPDPYSTTNQKKVCQVQDITLSNQGAPVAVTGINEEAFAKKTQFRITIKNVGGGDVIKDDMLERCGPTGDKIGREDVDKVKFVSVKAGTFFLDCGPFIDSAPGLLSSSGYMRLINGEGSVICELKSEAYAAESKTAYTTPMAITLEYGYRNTAERKILIKKEGSSFGTEVS